MGQSQWHPEQRTSKLSLVAEEASWMQLQKERSAEVAFYLGGKSCNGSQRQSNKITNWHIFRINLNDGVTPSVWCEKKKQLWPPNPGTISWTISRAVTTPVPTSKSIYPSNLDNPNLLSRFKSENWEDVSAPAISKLRIAAASNRPQETWHIFLLSQWEKFSWAISTKIFYHVMATGPKRGDTYFSFLISHISQNIFQKL